MDKRVLGSLTAKGGFANEKDICNKFNNWVEDEVAQRWLEIMGYNTKKIESLNAIYIPTRIKKKNLVKYGILKEDYNELIKFKKADAQIRIQIKLNNITKIENISLKKANSNADYNQVDKRTVSDYQKMWNFDDEIAFWLKLFTGEINPEEHLDKNNIKRLRDDRRMFLDEMPNHIQDKIINFFNKNKILIISDIIKGRGGLSAQWILVTRLNTKENTTTWTLCNINIAMNFFGQGDVKISPNGSLYVGKITMQRKGGTPDPTKLQFKIKPCQLFFCEV